MDDKEPIGKFWISERFPRHLGQKHFQKAPCRPNQQNAMNKDQYVADVLHFFVFIYRLVVCKGSKGLKELSIYFSSYCRIMIEQVEYYTLYHQPDSYAFDQIVLPKEQC